MDYTLMTFYHIMNRSQMHIGNLIIERLITQLPNQQYIVLYKNKSNDLDRNELAKKFKDKIIGNLGFLELIFYILLKSKSQKSVFVFHAINTKVFFFMYFLNKIGIKYPKIIWVCWGEGVKDKRNSLLGSLLNSIQSPIYQGLEKIIVLLNSDKESLVDIFKCDSNKVCILPYPIDIEFNPNSYELFKNKFNNNKILIGHSATPSLNHKKWLKILSKSANKKNISIYMFLNYSADSLYIEKVNSFAKENFIGSNLNIFRDFLSTSDYNKVFEEVNFYFSSATRQFGLGAIYTSIINGVTLYLDIHGANARWMDYIGIKYKDIRELETNPEVQAISVEDLVYNARQLDLFIKEHGSIESWTKALVGN